MSNKILVSASAFYKNDTQSGIGIVIKNNNSSDLEEVIFYYMRCYLEAWYFASKSQREEFVRGYFEQLDYYSKFKANELSDEDNFTCLINIWFLEKYNLLETDNFNGCVFLYE